MAAIPNAKKYGKGNRNRGPKGGNQSGLSDDDAALIKRNIQKQLGGEGVTKIDLAKAAQLARDAGHSQYADQLAVQLRAAA